MLHRVMEWARRNDYLVPPGFKVKAVRWSLVFDSDGGFLLVRELGDVESKRNRGADVLCPNLEQPEMKRGGPGTRHFLVDNTQVVTLLAVEPDDEKLKKHTAKHEYFVNLLAEAGGVVAELASVAGALRDPAVLVRIRKELEDLGAKPTENCTVEVRGADPERIVEGEAWHGWYSSFRSKLQKQEARSRMRCLLSGDLVEPVATQDKITGLADVGGLSMGDVLTAFKQESFRSYGLEQAANAAMSEEMAAGCTAALNRLIRRHSEKLAGNRIVYWYDEPLASGAEDPLSWILDPAETTEMDALEQARKLLHQIRTAEAPSRLASNRYFALNLAGNSGRVVIRDWMEGSFEELVANVEAWFADLQVVSRDGTGIARPPKLWAVLGSLVRELKELHDPLVARVWRAAARNEPIPQQAAASALARFRIAVMTNQAVRTAGVGLLRAFLRRPPNEDHNMTPALNEKHPEPAYHCGRLMAVLDYLQFRALGDVGAGIVQRYYAAASSTPSLVLGRLLRLAQFHLNKLEPRERQGFERRIGQVMNQLNDTFPPPLSLEQQSLFALGYYHQKSYRPPKDGPGSESPDSGGSTTQEENP